MTPVGERAADVSKVVAVIKDLPLWLLGGIAASAIALLLVPSITRQLPDPFHPWLVIVAVVSGTLTIFRLISVTHGKLMERLASQSKRRTFHITPDPLQGRWHITRQVDDSMTTQIMLRGLVKNLTDAPLGLATLRLIKPRIEGEVLHADVSVPRAGSNVYGTATHSGHQVPPKGSVPVSIHIMLRGTPRRDSSDALPVVIGVSDDEGNEQRTKATLKGEPRTRPVEPVFPSEKAFAIESPIEREIVSVLQSEITRYEKNGRERGGFGSIHIVYQGRVLTGFGQDSWTDSPRNQSIVDDVDAAELHSDLLAALLSFYERISTNEERSLFVSALLDRLNEEDGYLRVTYFIVCVLWKVGRLSDALQKARGLSEDERRAHGLSNALYMLNGLLRYRYVDFTPEMLDQIERFIHALKSEHTFRISEKIAAIRAARLSMRST
jgi:hypothetical protein